MNFPEHEGPVRRALGEAMLAFVQGIAATRLGQDEEDPVLRQVATEHYRQAVETAAAQGVEAALAWHTLAVWTEQGKERIGYFSRALEGARAEDAETPATTPKGRWSEAHMAADCLFEIGRVHAHEGDAAVARGFLEQALPLARRTEALQAAAGVTDDRLEGRIAELLLQLPDEGAE